MSDPVVLEARRLLREAADAETQKAAQHFSREPIRCYGVKAAAVRRIAKDCWKKIGSDSKDRIFARCERLWRSGMLEECSIACEWAYALHKTYTHADFSVFARWLSEYVDNWAACDTLCNHAIGTAVEMYPELVDELIAWTGSENRWKRRGAAVTLIIPARKGLFLEQVFAIADRLLRDDDDLVQKGYGWMLKAASEAHLPEIYAFVTARKATMPRTAYRYALEKTPPDMRREAMRKA